MAGIIVGKRITKGHKKVTRVIDIHIKKKIHIFTDFCDFSLMGN